MAQCVRRVCRAPGPGRRRHETKLRALQAPRLGLDELRPVSNTTHNWTQPALGVTLIDAMSTLWVLGLRDEFKEAADHIANAFDPLAVAGGKFVDVFETFTRRVLGGLVSAHALSGDGRLLDAAETFADVLAPALSASPSGIPFRGIASLRDGLYHPRPARPAARRPPARCCSSSGPWRAWRADPTSRHWPCAPGERCTATGRVQGPRALEAQDDAERLRRAVHVRNQSKLTVGSGVDSYYEYLLKGWLQEGGSGRPPRTWSDAVDAVDANLINVRGPTTFMADIEEEQDARESSHASSVLLAGLASTGGDRGSSGRVVGPAPRGEAARRLRRGLRRDADEPGPGGLARERRRLHQARPVAAPPATGDHRERVLDVPATRKQKMGHAAARASGTLYKARSIDGGGFAALGQIHKQTPARVDKMDSGFSQRR